MSKSRLKTFRVRRQIRQRRGRGKIVGTAAAPRLSVFRSHRYLFAQLIDDSAGRTLLGLRSLASLAKAEEFGRQLAKRALGQKIQRVIFDRSGYRYAGQVKALALGARAGGLIF